MNFNQYSLALMKDGRIVFSSDKSGLRPLVECITDEHQGVVLYDKVVGLAAARLIVYSGIAKRIITTTISKPALEYLEKKLTIEYKEVVDNILTEDRSDICPMEKKAMSIDDDEFFYVEAIKSFSKSPQRPHPASCLRCLGRGHKAPS